MLKIVTYIFHDTLYSTNVNKDKILQHNTLDANSFFSAKLSKQTKKCLNIFEAPIKILRDEGFI